MKDRRTASLTRALTVILLMLALVVSMAQHSQAGPELPLLRRDFSLAAPQGFGDRENSWAWSMIWWKDKLYVGTNRSWLCFQAASNVVAFPWAWYPPNDPDIECPDQAEDLDLRAEIWCWTPGTDTWERLYQSPNDVEIPGHPGKYVARDIGYRYMTVFTEPDGTEALYVSGVSARNYIKGIPPPRILRSTDGRAFDALPQDPGTFLGDLDTLDGIDMNSFRNLVVYNGRLYASLGRVYGNGVLLEAADPAGGNDNWRKISPPGLTVFQMCVFNGYLYIGTTDAQNGYSVLKTDATGELPYTFTPVVTDGGSRRPRPSGSVISMYPFRGKLYVGTDRPAELIRISPDDSWDLVVGEPRDTANGRKEPLSGMGDGFDYWLNGHMWRMVEHDGWLYVGTWDETIVFHTVDWIAELLGPQMGFDLYATYDGIHFLDVTHTGFDDMFNYGLRTFESTPYGLFVGTANAYYGLQVWLGIKGDTGYTYLPLITFSADQAQQP